MQALPIQHTLAERLCSFYACPVACSGRLWAVGVAGITLQMEPEQQDAHNNVDNEVLEWCMECDADIDEILDRDDWLSMTLTFLRRGADLHATRLAPLVGHINHLEVNQVHAL